MVESLELEQLFYNFIEKAGSLVADKIKTNPLLSTEVFEIQEEHSAKILRIPDYSKALSSIETEVENLQEFEEFLTFIQNEAKSFEHDPDFRFMLKSLILRVLDVLSRSDDHETSNYDLKENISSVMEELEHWLYDEYVEFVELIPLMAFEADSNLLAITEGVTIRSVTKEEREFFLNQTKDYSFLNSKECKYVVEIIRKAEKGDISSFPPKLVSSNLNADRDLLLNIVTAFWLLGEGNVFYNFIFYQYRLKILGFKSRLSLNLYQPHGKAYNFEQAQLSKLKTLQSYLQTSSMLLSLVLRRFNYTYERKDFSDRVIDLAIAFEILLSKEKDLKESITFKLRVRAARLLGESIEEKETVAETISKFYSLRSSIVHGGKLNISDNDRLTVRSAENYLRKSIISYVRTMSKSIRGKGQFDHDAFIESLDYC